MSNDNATFNTAFFPQHVALVSVGENLLPMGYWTVISKEPFRLLLCMGVGNHSLGLLRQYQEAALHLMPWRDRERVARAGYLSGRQVDKAAQLGFVLRPAARLIHTRLVEGAVAAFELRVWQELPGLSTEFVLFVLDVVATHGARTPAGYDPILYLSRQDFATLGEQWRLSR